MAARLMTHVSLFDAKGNLQSFGPDSDVPDWARKRITNPNVWDSAPKAAKDDSGDAGDQGDDSGQGDDGGQEPEVPGSRAKKSEWEAYAKALGVEVDGTKDEIVAAIEKAGYPVA